MKSIIVGIDFQNQSYSAMKFAVNMALRIQTKLVLVFVNKRDRSKDIFQRPKDKVAAEAKKRFEDLIDKYKNQLSSDHFEYRIAEGEEIYEELDLIASKNRADIIVIGTHGKTGSRLFNSSGAFRIVENCTIPVVTIKDGAKISTDIKIILVPIDSSVESRQKVPFSVKIAHIFGAQIHMLAMNHSKTESIKENIRLYTKQAAEYMEKQSVNFVVKSIETDDVVRTTINYSEEIGADIIASMSTQLSATSNLWKGTFAEQIICKSHVPVLNIQTKDFIRTLSR